MMLVTKCMFCTSWACKDSSMCLLGYVRMSLIHSYSCNSSTTNMFFFTLINPCRARTVRLNKQSVLFVSQSFICHTTTQTSDFELCLQSVRLKKVLNSFLCVMVSLLGPILGSYSCSNLCSSLLCLPAG